MIDERSEQLINRKLDGELTEAESLELDKILLRSPEARALLEEYERADGLAADSLRAALSGDAPPDERAAQLARTGVRRRRLRRVSQVAAVAAVAAAVALAVVIGGRTTRRPESGTTPIASGPIDSGATEQPDAVEATPVDEYMVVIEGPRRRTQRVIRDIFGVFDEETQSVYLLEADRTQTTVVPVSMNY